MYSCLKAEINESITHMKHLKFLIITIEKKEHGFISKINKNVHMILMHIWQQLKHFGWCTNIQI